MQNQAQSIQANINSERDLQNIESPSQTIPHIRTHHDFTPIERGRPIMQGAHDLVGPAPPIDNQLNLHETDHIPQQWPATHELSPTIESIVQDIRPGDLGRASGDQYISNNAGNPLPWPVDAHSIGLGYPSDTVLQPSYFSSEGLPERAPAITSVRTLRGTFPQYNRNDR